jgi:hypothetical protein
VRNERSPEEQGCSSAGVARDGESLPEGLVLISRDLGSPEQEYTFTLFINMIQWKKQIGGGGNSIVISRIRLTLQIDLISVSII